MRIGFAGLGRMGGGMARRLLDTGHDLSVFDVSDAATAPFAEAGARVAASIADLAADRDVVVTMLVADSAVREVAIGSNGLSESLPAGAIHLVMGTHGVAVVREMEARHREAGQTLVAAPAAGLLKRRAPDGERLRSDSRSSGCRCRDSSVMMTPGCTAKARASSASSSPGPSRQ